MSSSPALTSPWYVRAFEADYSRRYKHRTDKAAQDEIAFAAAALSLKTGERVLDLCCGNGRHSRALHALKLNVMGIDLSEALLREARSRSPQAIRFVRADMRRIPLDDGGFDAVLNMFTSFGYFATDAENARVLQEAVRVLRPGGRLLFDFLNRAAVLATLQRTSVRATDGACLREFRRFRWRSGRLEKLAVCGSGPCTCRILESVRAYSPRELEQLFTGTGLRITARFGDLKGAPFDPRRSPRCVLAAEKL